MSLVGSIVLLRTISRGHDFGERLEPSSALAIRELWNEIERKCFKMYTSDPNNSLLFDVYETLNASVKQCKRDLTIDPEQTHVHECHVGIESMYNQCREAASLGEMEAADQSKWAIREVVFPVTRTSVVSPRD